jgi:hypothetical protein
MGKPAQTTKHARCSRWNFTNEKVHQPRACLLNSGPVRGGGRQGTTRFHHRRCPVAGAHALTTRFASFFWASLPRATGLRGDDLQVEAPAPVHAAQARAQVHPQLRDRLEVARVPARAERGGLSRDTQKGPRERAFSQAAWPAASPAAARRAPRAGCSPDGPNVLGVEARVRDKDPRLLAALGRPGQQHGQPPAVRARRQRRVAGVRPVLAPNSVETLVDICL